VALVLKVAVSPLVHVVGPSQTPAVVQTVLAGLEVFQVRSAASVGTEKSAAAMAGPVRKRLSEDIMRQAFADDSRVERRGCKGRVVVGLTDQTGWWRV
jgi:hypothetical protein